MSFRKKRLFNTKVVKPSLLSLIDNINKTKYKYNIKIEIINEINILYKKYYNKNINIIFNSDEKIEIDDESVNLNEELKIAFIYEFRVKLVKLNFKIEEEINYQKLYKYKNEIHNGTIVTTSSRNVIIINILNYNIIVPINAFLRKDNIIIGEKYNFLIYEDYFNKNKICVSRNNRKFLFKQFLLSYSSYDQTKIIKCYRQKGILYIIVNGDDSIQDYISKRYISNLKSISKQIGREKVVFYNNNTPIINIYFKMLDAIKAIKTWKMLFLLIEEHKTLYIIMDSIELETMVDNWTTYIQDLYEVDQINVETVEFKSNIGQVSSLINKNTNVDKEIIEKILNLCKTETGEFKLQIISKISPKYIKENVKISNEDLSKVLQLFIMHYLAMENKAMDINYGKHIVDNNIKIYDFLKS